MYGNGYPGRYCTYATAAAAAADAYPGAHCERCQDRGYRRGVSCQATHEAAPIAVSPGMHSTEHRPSPADFLSIRRLKVIPFVSLMQLRGRKIEVRGNAPMRRRFTRLRRSFGVPINRAPAGFHPAQLFCLSSCRRAARFPGKTCLFVAADRSRIKVWRS